MYTPVLLLDLSPRLFAPSFFFVRDFSIDLSPLSLVSLPLWNREIDRFTSHEFGSGSALVPRENDR